MAFDFPFRDPSLDIEARLDDLMSRLTLEEKMGFIPSKHAPVERLGIGEFCVGGEGAHGYIDRLGPATTFPQTIGLAATFDRDLLFKIGQVTGKEARGFYNRTGKKGGTTLWFPTVDLERNPYWGRTEEGYGEDPYLTSELAKCIIRGAQNDNGKDPLMVTSGPKHFFANNNEYHRGSCNCSISPRLLREYYTVPFKAAIKDAGAYSVMSSYNEVNGTPMMLNPMLNDLVKDEWGMRDRGHIVTDGGDFEQTVIYHHYFKEHCETIAHALKNGADSMTDSAEVVIPALKEAINRGLLTEEELDPHVRAILRVRFKLGQFDPSTPYDDLNTADLVNCDEHKALTRRAVAESCVLLRNHGALPIKGGRIAVIGHMATQLHMDWYTAFMDYKVTVLDGLKARFGEENVDYLEARDIVSFCTPNGLPLVLSGKYDALTVGEKGQDSAKFYLEDWGFGSVTLRSLENGKLLDLGHILKPNEEPDEERRAEMQRIETEYPARAISENSLSWYVKTQFTLVPQGDGKVLIKAFDGRLASWGKEGESVKFGKPFAPGEENLFSMCTVNNEAKAMMQAKDYDTVVTVVGSNPMIHARECIDRHSLLLPPRDEQLIRNAALANPQNVAIIMTSYPYDCGISLHMTNAAVTLAHGMQETGNGLADILSGDISPAGRLPMTWVYDHRYRPETVMDYDIMHGEMTYLWNKDGICYPFGHGMSYAEFAYTGLKIAPAENGWQVSFTLSNNSDFEAQDVPQMYIAVKESALPRPIMQLKGFERVTVPANGSVTVSFPLPYDELRIWDVNTDSFVLERGFANVMIGASSGDIKLVGQVIVPGKKLPPRELSGVIYAWKCDDYEDVTFIEKRGSKIPAVLTNSEFGGEIDFKNCVSDGTTKLRICCAGYTASGARLDFLIDDGDVAASAVIPMSVDIADWPKQNGEQNFPTWQIVECPVNLPKDTAFDLRLLTTGTAAIHSIEFIEE